MSAPSITLTSVRVDKFIYEPEVIDIASRFLDGYYGDYFMFQYAVGDYVILYDFDEEPQIDTDGITCTGCMVYELKSCSALPLQIDEYALDLVDIGTGASVMQGSAKKTEFSTSYKSYIGYYPNQISVQTNDYVCYSSADNYPHLVEGVQNYAFAAFMLVFGVIGFKLADRLFRRIY